MELSGGHVLCRRCPHHPGHRRRRHHLRWGDPHGPRGHLGPEPRWDTEVGGRLGTYGYRLALDKKGTIYFGATTYPGPPGGAVYGLNAAGTLKWEFDTPDGTYVRTPVGIGTHHRLY